MYINYIHSWDTWRHFPHLSSVFPKKPFVCIYLYIALHCLFDIYLHIFAFLIHAKLVSLCTVEGTYQKKMQCNIYIKKGNRVRKKGNTRPTVVFCLCVFMYMGVGCLLSSTPHRRESLRDGLPFVKCNTRIGTSFMLKYVNFFISFFEKWARDTESKRELNSEGWKFWKEETVIKKKCPVLGRK